MGSGVEALKQTVSVLLRETWPSYYSYLRKRNSLGSNESGKCVSSQMEKAKDSLSGEESFIH